MVLFMLNRIVVFMSLLSMFTFVSCNSSKKIAYFQNVKDDSYKSGLGIVEAPIQKNDILSINISSLNDEASAIFNPQANAGNKQTTTSTGGSIQSGGYLVNSDGFIQLPILGNVQAAGLTK